MHFVYPNMEGLFDGVVRPYLPVVEANFGKIYSKTLTEFLDTASFRAFRVLRISPLNHHVVSCGD